MAGDQAPPEDTTPLLGPGSEYPTKEQLAATERCCCFSRGITQRFLTCDSWNAFTGPKWNVNKLRTQLMGDIVLCSLIFIITEAITMYEARYWRPIAWGIYWITVQLVVATIGIVGGVKRSPGYLIVFVVLTIMFSCTNISHTNELRENIVRSCHMSQISFKDCDPTQNSKAKAVLSGCIYKNTCTAEQIEQTDCKAPGSVHCSDVNSTVVMFWFNSVINFFTYAEPCFWAFLLLIRAEKTNDTCPDEPKDEEEFPYPDIGPIFGDELADGDGTSQPLMSNADSTKDVESQ